MTLGSPEASLHRALVRAAHHCPLGRGEVLLDLRRLLRDLFQRGQTDPFLQNNALWHLRPISIQILEPAFPGKVSK